MSFDSHQKMVILSLKYSTITGKVRFHDVCLGEKNVGALWFIQQKHAKNNNKKYSSVFSKKVVKISNYLFCVKVMYPLNVWHTYPPALRMKPRNDVRSEPQFQSPYWMT